MNILCTGSNCQIFLASKCVFYEGDTLVYTGINNNDSLTVALEKIDAALGSIDPTVEWGDITGDLEDQTDLIDYLTSTYVPQTRTITINGITYDLSDNREWNITAAIWGSITGDIEDQLDLIAFLSGNYYPLASNPAGYLTSSSGGMLYVPLGRELTINGVTYDLSANRTWTISAGVWGEITGDILDQTDLITYLSANYYPLGNPAGYITGADVPTYETDPVFTAWLTGPPDLSEFNNDVGYITSSALSPYLTTAAAASTYVPLIRQLTINGQTFDLSADRTWSVAIGVTNVTASLPLTSSGGATPNIAIPVASGSADGYLSSTDWNTFNNKQPAGSYLTGANISDTAYGPSWDGVTTIAPSKNAVYDRIESIITSVNTSFDVQFDGMGAVILVNTIIYMRIANNCTISGWSIVAEGTSPTCSIDILKIASGTVLPTSSITAGAPAQLTTGNAIKSTSMPGWTLSWAADDMVAIKITACSAATKINFTLFR